MKTFFFFGGLEVNGGAELYLSMLRVYSWLCAKRSVLVVPEIKASSAVYKASILSSALSLQLHFFIFNTVFFLLLTQALTLIEDLLCLKKRELDQLPSGESWLSF